MHLKSIKTKVIFFNGRFLTQPITGVQRFALEVIKAFDCFLGGQPNLRNKYTFKILIPKTTIISNLKFKHIQVVSKGMLNGHFWEQIQLPFFTKTNGLINLCNTGPALKRNQIVVIHDAAVFGIPHNFSFFFRLFYKNLFFLFKKFTKKIITVSEFSKSEIEKYLKIKNKEIIVAYEGHEHILNTPSDLNVLKKHNLIPKNFVFALSSLNPNKNFESISKVASNFPISEMKFVFAGGINNKVFKQIQLPSDERIKYLGYINDSELRTLLDNALCFIFPSFYEGFGLPPLESMACGCPTIVSNIPTLKEIGGNGALYCNPNMPSSISDLLLKLIESKKLQEDISIKGKERSKSFTWRKTSEILFQQILCLK